MNPTSNSKSPSGEKKVPVKPRSGEVSIKLLDQMLEEALAMRAPLKASVKKAEALKKLVPGFAHMLNEGYSNQALMDWMKGRGLQISLPTLRAFLVKEGLVRPRGRAAKQNQSAGPAPASELPAPAAQDALPRPPGPHG